MFCESILHKQLKYEQTINGIRRIEELWGYIGHFELVKTGNRSNSIFDC